MMILWDKTDFIGFFEALPEEDEHFDIFCQWNVAQAGLQLSLRIDVNCGDVSVTISHGDYEAPFVHPVILGCPMARVVADTQPAYIEFAPGRVFGGRYDEECVIEFGFRLHKSPNWRVELFRK